MDRRGLLIGAVGLLSTRPLLAGPFSASWLEGWLNGRHFDATGNGTTIDASLIAQDVKPTKDSIATILWGRDRQTDAFAFKLKL